MHESLFNIVRNRQLGYWSLPRLEPKGKKEKRVTSNSSATTLRQYLAPKTWWDLWRCATGLARLIYNRVLEQMWKLRDKPALRDMLEGKDNLPLGKELPSTAVFRHQPTGRGQAAAIARPPIHYSELFLGMTKDAARPKLSKNNLFKVYRK